MRSTSKKVQVVPALEKALDILEYIGAKGDFVTIKEISAELGIPLATAYRTVNYLLSRHYLQQHAEIEGDYFLGQQIQRLANVISRNFDLASVAKPVMRQLASQSGQTVQLGALQGYEIVYIEQILPDKPVNIIASLGIGLPVNSSASGKVLVAHLSSDEQEEFLQKTVLEAQTPRSITNVDEFRQELHQVKAQGFAIDNEEYARGIGCLAVPIRNFSGQVIAAIGLTGHSTEYQGDNFEKYKRMLMEAGRSISSSINS